MPKTDTEMKKIARWLFESMSPEEKQKFGRKLANDFAPVLESLRKKADDARDK